MCCYVVKLEIEEYEESQAKEEMMMQADSDEEDKKKKKDKHRKNLFRADRTMLVNRIMDLAFPYYHMIDIETGLNKFK